MLAIHPHEVGLEGADTRTLRVDLGGHRLAVGTVDEQPRGGDADDESRDGGGGDPAGDTSP